MRSALGQKQTCALISLEVCLVPTEDIGRYQAQPLSEDAISSIKMN